MAVDRRFTVKTGPSGELEWACALCDAAGLPPKMPDLCGYAICPWLATKRQAPDARSSIDRVEALFAGHAATVTDESGGLISARASRTILTDFVSLRLNFVVPALNDYTFVPMSYVCSTAGAWPGTLQCIRRDAVKVRDEAHLTDLTHAALASPEMRRVVMELKSDRGTNKRSATHG